MLDLNRIEQILSTRLRASWPEMVSIAIHDYNANKTKIKLASIDKKSILIILITYKDLNGMTPDYMYNLLLTYISARSLRSSGQNLLTVLNSGNAFN